TGLHYNRHRYYDPDSGRFISKDPIGFEGGINVYAYVGGNPISYSDPSGLVPNPAEAACVLGPNPVCIGGVVADVGSWIVGVLGVGALTAAVSTSGSTQQSPARQAEYELAKNFCDTPPPQGGSECSNLSKAIDHAKQCVGLYERWDAKWLPGRHTQKINTWKQRIQNLKAEHNRKCTNK
ncbi:RHS repeat-associated core domain-containing protein, partial [Burkholderia cepacia]